MEIINLPTDTISKSINNFITPSGVTIEEGIVMGRVFNLNSIDTTKAGVNVATANKQQSIWNGQYQVKLRRGFGIPAVYCTGTFGRGAHEGEGLVYGESVTVMWLDRSSTSVPIILKGTSLEYYQKLLTGDGHLLDSGEKILRSAISKKPEITQIKDAPFADNQTDNPKTAPATAGDYTKNSDKIINNPGGELFFDKFGRLLLTGRHSEHEFMVTIGKTDSGQDDTSSLTTKTAQDSYYSAISTDEDVYPPKLVKEPFAPKAMNLAQYQLIQQQVSVNGKQETQGFLPRFDLWKFQPIVVRPYSASGSDTLNENIYSVYQLRGNKYAFTVTEMGDVKEYVARNENHRVVSDMLISVGGNYDLGVKTNFNDNSFKGRFTIKATGEMFINSNERLTVTAVSGTSLYGGTGPVYPVLEPMVLGNTLQKKVLDELIANALTNWLPIPMDGAVALKTLLLTLITQYPLTNYLSSYNQVN
jgi:hypothetical protein